MPGFSREGGASGSANGRARALRPCRRGRASLSRADAPAYRTSLSLWLGNVFVVALFVVIATPPFCRERFGDAGEQRRGVVFFLLSFFGELFYKGGGIFGIFRMLGFFGTCGVGGVLGEGFEYLFGIQLFTFFIVYIFTIVYTFLRILRTNLEASN